MTERPKRIPIEEIAEIVSTWPTASGFGPHIAERYDVPLPTAYRWINETRRRGLLPDGTRERPCPNCDGTGAVRWGRQAAEQGAGA